MNFAYVDERGGEDHSEVFIMVGCLVDAYRLRRITADFDRMLRELFERHPGNPRELKASAFINGKGGWSEVPADERKALFRAVCALAAKDTNLFASALSFQRFRKALKGKRNHPTRGDHWHAASMFVTSLIQKKVQKEKEE